ncbi:glycoside hydrolase family 30 beta sandwich domain-containing protein [Sphingomonas beigongshangi]|uniref:glycoside hydrolase family 30 beta sandwich domain-containing protein n=1 Tax=Sphingomonas beigongshangi TaxID=2782540 RepID=UPI003D0CDA33
MPSLAFRNPDGGKVLLVFNSGDSLRRVVLEDGGRRFQFDLPPISTRTVTCK